MVFTLASAAGSELLCLLAYSVLGLHPELHSAGGRIMIFAPVLAPVLLTPIMALPVARSHGRALTLLDQLQATTTRLREEITERQAVQQQLEYLARHDELTGVLNRRGFFESAGDPIESASLALVDLDDFKSVNDRWGHSAGDQALVAVSAELTRLAGPDALIARLGGDEFVALLPGSDPAALERIGRSLSRVPLLVGGETVIVSAAVGEVTVTGPITIDEALGQADALMYRAKNRGYHRYIG